MCKFSQPHKKHALRQPGKLAIIYLPCPKRRAKQGYWLTYQNTNDVFPYVHFPHIPDTFFGVGSFCWPCRPMRVPPALGQPSSLSFFSLPIWLRAAVFVFQ
uniref:Uncharacterized protein n=2 Tax=Vibrio TaxID=662 RepID=A0A0H3ZSE8_9VIBR|nr:hypothetical protein [Vibrio kanaloae]AKN38287.1 hypothetical protein [Vibrio sp. 1S_269]AKN37392.1 hypothetical protein [Vibrio kanaloae]AKN37796.1 hypothetical protein [Vibrio kanaloae]AKN38886.1 hypothetical protein [Vibrio kanaloae]